MIKKVLIALCLGVLVVPISLPWSSGQVTGGEEPRTEPADYGVVGYAAARAAGRTAADVAAMDYAKTAELCGVKIGEKGESPAGFFYQVARRQIADELAADEAEAGLVDLVAASQAALPDAVVMVDKDKVVRVFADARDIPPGVEPFADWRDATRETKDVPAAISR